MPGRFESVRITAEDYRHRGLPEAPPAFDDDAVRAARADEPGASLDELRGRWPGTWRGCTRSKYGALLDGVGTVCLTGVQPSTTRRPRCGWWCSPTGSTTATCRWSPPEPPSTHFFAPPLLEGGYRKKYLRAVSRLVALAREAHEVARRAG